MNDDRAQKTPNDVHEQHKWITIDEAFLVCQEVGLDRTKKTIRSWCRHEHIESRKQTTPTGERWMVEAASLSVKLRNELEFQRPDNSVRTSVNQFEQVRPADIPVRTSANPSEPGRPAAGVSEPILGTKGDEKRLGELEADVRSLEIDKAVRDRHVEFLSNQNEEGQKNLLSQSRYIGHLETQVLQLGGRPDQQFLEAPVPGNGEHVEKQVFNDEIVQKHPNQRHFDIHTDGPIQS